MSNRFALCSLPSMMMMMLLAQLGIARHEPFASNKSPAFVGGWRKIKQSRDCRQSENFITPPPTMSSQWLPKQRTAQTRHMTDTDSQQFEPTDTTDTTSTKRIAVWTRERLKEYASEQGIVLTLSTLGPGYRALARAKHNTTLILGYVEGFVRPTGNILHMDKMQVFSKIVQQTRNENPQEFKGGGTIFGPGLLVGYLCLLFGAEQGCRVAEFLAIDDEDFQHKRLVRFYKNSGFDVVKYVGEDFKDIPDRLIWGGCGTLLRQEIPTLLDFWTRLLERRK